MAAAKDTSGKEMTARTLDLVARSVDLLTVLTNATNGSDSFLQVAKEIGRWLGREKLNENDLQFCLESARDLVKPNLKGELFYAAVVSGTPERVAGPLFAQPSGALGRYMARDRHLRWMTSTITCLFEFHGESFISDVICALVMQARFANRDGKPLSEYQMAWHPVRIQLKSVIDKIVSSIWFNVVNSGVLGSENETLPLPDEIKSICPRGHNLESHRLGLVLAQLRKPPPQVIIDSEHILTNLVLWLIYHFGGRLRVVVGAKIVYDQILGEEESQIELRVSRSCPADGQCTSTSAKVVPTFKMYTAVAGKFEKLLSGKYDTQITLESQPRVRRKLYHSPITYPKGVGKNSIDILTKCTAQEIMRWLLDRPVVREPYGGRLVFRIILAAGHPDRQTGLRVADVLGRVPAIVNMRWGTLESAKVVFSEPIAPTPPTVDEYLKRDDDSVLSDALDEDEEEDDPDGDRLECILPYFPILQDLLEKVQRSCRCTYCYKTGPWSRFRFQPGCLQHTSMLEVMFYLAHGIADAFGAPDASALSATNMTDLGVVQVLLDVVSLLISRQELEGYVKWDTWVNSAAQVFLGCDPLTELTQSAGELERYDIKANFMEYLDATVVAIQYGNLAVIAPWLDISKQVSKKQCFRFITAKGRLGLINDEGSQHSSFQGIEEECAVIETQHTEDTVDYLEQYKKQEETPGFEVKVESDQSLCQCDYVLISADSRRHKLLMRVSSGSHSRMVNPSQAMLKVSNGLHTITCSHEAHRTAIVPDDQILELYSFDELLGRWSVTSKKTQDSPDDSSAEDDEEAPEPIIKHTPVSRKAGDAPAAGSRDLPRIRVSHILDSYFKQNVALALAGDDPVFVNKGTACLACTLSKVSTFQVESYLKTHGRWVIYKAKNPSTVMPRPSLRLRQTVSEHKANNNGFRRGGKRIETTLAAGASTDIDAAIEDDEDDDDKDVVMEMED